MECDDRRGYCAGTIILISYYGLRVRRHRSLDTASIHRLIRRPAHKGHHVQTTPHVGLCITHEFISQRQVDGYNFKIYSQTNAVIRSSSVPKKAKRRQARVSTSVMAVDDLRARGRGQGRG